MEDVTVTQQNDVQEVGIRLFLATNSCRELRESIDDRLTSRATNKLVGGLLHLHEAVDVHLIGGDVVGNRHDHFVCDVHAETERILKVRLSFNSSKYVLKAVTVSVICYCHISRNNKVSVLQLPVYCW